MDRSISEEYDSEEKSEIDADLDFRPTEKLDATGDIVKDFPVLSPYSALYSRINFGNIDVYINNGIFSKDNVSWTQNGKKVHGSNKDRMATGRAAIGTDNRPINLHHIYQTQDGPIIELLQSFHQNNYSALHKNTGQSPSKIDRSTFASWRRRYWQSR